MLHPHAFIQALATVMCVAAVTTVVFQKLHQPVVLGYIIAGLIIGPHVPIPFVADAAIVHALSELGVILLMFSLGLEFSLRKLLKVGPSAGLTALVECGLMMWLGFVVARALGFGPLESIFTGAFVAISSTTIIAKAFDEQSVRGALREGVVSILIVEDLIAVLVLATLTAVTRGAGLSASALALTVGRLGAFLAGLLVVGLLVVPRSLRAIVELKRDETTLVASIGICFAVALLALQFGYSVALGAFLAGSLIAESGEERKVERLVAPVRDVFGAVFFVSVGLLIDPNLVAQHWLAVLVLIVVVLVGKTVGVSLGTFLTGSSIRTSVQTGMSLAQIGEFSFIIVGLGQSLNEKLSFLYPVAVAVSAVTTLTTPWMIRASAPVASFIDRKLPHALQTYASLYGSWIEAARNSPPKTGLRRLVRLLILDASLLAAVIIGLSLSFDDGRDWVQGRLGVTPTLAHVLVIGGGCAVALPFGIGIVRIAGGIGATLADRALPAISGAKIDLAAAPRRALVVSLQLASVFVVGLPLLALTQPFLPGFQGAALFVALLLVLGLVFWRSANHLQGHVRAGAQAIVEALASGATRASRASSPEASMKELRALLPGIGEPVAVQLKPESPSVGKTLAELNLRGLTGATVLAIRRGEEGVIVPSAGEVLKAEDVLALAGSQAAIEAAKAWLLEPQALPVGA